MIAASLISVFVLATSPPEEAADTEINRWQLEVRSAQPTSIINSVPNSSPTPPGLTREERNALARKNIRKLGLFIESTTLARAPEQYVSQYHPPQDTGGGWINGLANGLNQGMENYAIGASRGDIELVEQRNYLLSESIKAYRLEDFNRAEVLINKVVDIDNKRHNGDSPHFTPETF